MPYYRCPGCALTVHSAAAHSAVRTCPNCSATLPDDGRLYPTPSVRRSIRRVVAARPDAIGKARRALVGLAVAETIRADIALVMSELVTNAIRHAGLSDSDPISVHITSDESRVRLAVRDGGPGFARPALEGHDPLTPGGHGYVIVAALSDTWGIDCAGDGCTVWCEFEVGDEPAAVQAREVTGAYIEELAVEMATTAAVQAS
jgi:anti-sigma regulatory factor (Ser/Thr protein kinase)